MYNYRCRLAALLLIISCLFVMPVTSYAVASTGYDCLDNFFNDSRFTEGVSWPRSTTPKVSSFSCIGCLAYCADYTAYCFGVDDPRDGEKFYSAYDIQVGDVVQTNGELGDHWFFCIKRDGTTLTIAEGNFNVKVHIGRSVSIQDASSIKEKSEVSTFVCGYHFDLDSTQPKSIFSDVSEGSWYYDNVKYVVDQGLFNGVGNNEFQPNGTMTREMFVTVLYRLAGEPSVSGSAGFSDVTNTGSWYYNAVLWAKNADVTSGISATSFGVGNGLKRQDMITLMYRYAKQNGLAFGSPSEDALNSFYDADKVSSYAREAMCWAVEKGILTGMAGTDTAGNKVIILQPSGVSTRAQVAAVIQRMVQD